MSWYKIVLSPRMVGLGLLGEITDRVAAIRESKNTPDTFNVFIGKQGKGQGMTLYFTPDAAYYAEILLKKTKGTECEKPALEELAFTISGQRVTPELLVDD